MQSTQHSSSLQLIKHVLSQLSRDEPLSSNFSQHACTAVLAMQPLIRGCGSPDTQQLTDVFHQLLTLLSKRCLKGMAQEQALALQIWAACIRACDAVLLLQNAVMWGNQLSEIMRKGAAVAAGTHATNSSATSSTAPILADAFAVLQASCAAGSELFIRLQQYIQLPAVRREVSAAAAKLMHPLLAILDNSSVPDAVQAAALQLQANLLRCVPSSLRSVLAQMERALQQLVQRAAASTAARSLSLPYEGSKRQLLAQAALCCALLPAVHGDASAWSDTARRLTISCHDVLDHLLMGLEGRPLDPQWRSYLEPEKQQQQQQQPKGEITSHGWLSTLPWKQQDQDQQQTQGAAVRQHSAASILMCSFCLTALQQLLKQPFVAPVPVPGYSLALLAARLLKFDAAAAVSAGAVPGSKTVFHELLVIQPHLQLCGWQLAQQVIATCGNQLQLQGALLRVVRQGMRTVQLSGPLALQQRHVMVRSCMYDTAAQLLQALGVAGVRGVAAEIMGCVVLELYGHAPPTDQAGGSSTVQRPAKRARKSGGASGNELGQFEPATAVAAAASNEAALRVAAAAGDLHGQVAAMNLLQHLLSVGGQVLPAEVRAHADAICYHTSSLATQLNGHLKQQPALSTAAKSGSSVLEALQVAAYEALLTSLLVPCGHRPPFLSQAVALFRQGRSSSNAAIAATCQSASLQVEALLHPRALPVSTVREYTGMAEVPVLTKPRMWDLMMEQCEPAAGGAAAANATADRTTVMSSGEAQTNTILAAHTGATNCEAKQDGMRSDATPTPPAIAGVVLGYPVVSQAAVQHQQQQQVPQVAFGKAQDALDGLKNLVPVVMMPMRAHPQLIADPQSSIAEEPRATPSSQQLVKATEQPQQQQQQQQQQQENLATTAMDRQPDVVQLQRQLLQQKHKTTSNGPVGVVGSMITDESSDSEGPMPEIDSGDSSSCSDGSDE